MEPSCHYDYYKNNLISIEKNWSKQFQNKVMYFDWGRIYVNQLRQLIRYLERKLQQVPVLEERTCLWPDPICEWWTNVQIPFDHFQISNIYSKTGTFWLAPFAKYQSATGHNLVMWTDLYRWAKSTRALSRATPIGLPSYNHYHRAYATPKFDINFATQFGLARRYFFLDSRSTQ